MVRTAGAKTRAADRVDVLVAHGVESIRDAEARVEGQRVVGLEAGSESHVGAFRPIGGRGGRAELVEESAANVVEVFGVGVARFAVVGVDVDHHGIGVVEVPAAGGQNPVNL